MKQEFTATLTHLKYCALLGIPVVISHLLWGACPVFFVLIGFAIGAAVSVEYMQLLAYKNSKHKNWKDAIECYRQIRGWDTIIDLSCLLVIVFEFVVYKLIIIYLIGVIK